MTSIGHNRTRVGGVAVDQLRSIVERIERLTEEKEGIAADIRDVFVEAAANGFDRVAIRQVLKLRKQDAAERQEREHLLDLYLVALGMREQADLLNSMEEAAVCR